MAVKVPPIDLIDDLKTLVHQAVNDALEGRSKKSGKDLIPRFVPSVCKAFDLRNGEPGWLMRLYGAAYDMAKVHCCKDY